MSWKQIQFFEKTQLEPNKGSKSIDSIIKDWKTTCVSPGLFIGDSMGKIHHFDKSLLCTSSFQAYSGSVKLLKYVDIHGILLSIGCDDDGVIPVLKIWNVQNLPDHSPALIRTTRITHGNKGFPVTTLAILGKLAHVAIGLENGIVILLRGNLLKDKQSSAKVVYEGQESITGLGFREDEQGTSLFIATRNQLFSCSITTFENSDIAIINSKVGCCIMTPQTKNQDMIIADQEAIYFYGPEGIGPCFVVPGGKENLTWFKGYLVGISQEVAAKTGDQIPSQNNKDIGKTLLTIYDIRTKFIVFKDDFGKRIFSPFATKAVGEPILHIIPAFDVILVITDQAKIYQMKEVDMSKKLIALYAKNYYELALELVLQPPFESEGLSHRVSTTELVRRVTHDVTHPSWRTVTQICKRYGDFLYSKQEFDLANQQFINTIADLEPSYVIRKCLDAKQILNLTLYLKALHERNVATGDHTTLLINCFTKLNDLENLIEFIEASSSYDADAAISVCRNSGYFQQALRIASKFELHSWYIMVLVDDLRQYDDSVSYLGNLFGHELTSSLQKYGPVLVKSKPSKMTKLLLSKFKGTTDLNFDDVSILYISNPDEFILFLEGLLLVFFNIDLQKSDNFAHIDDSDKRLLGAVTDSLIYHSTLNWKRNSEAKKCEERILRLLNVSGIHYDIENALLWFQTGKFKPGELVIYDKLGLHTSSFKIHADRRDIDSILSLCKLHGQLNPNLWFLAIRYCVTSIHD